MFKNFKNIVSEKKRSFTLVELIIVVIIVGILAALGLNQYAVVVEKGRGVEAKTLLSAMRTDEQAYYLENGAYTGSLSALGTNVPASCDSSHYFSYWISVAPSTRCPGALGLYATRCTSGGKPPQGPSNYYVVLCPDTGTWMNDAPY
jgi:prepilin-type N-terminal cleavage/methylation domain-containing protein